MTFSISRPPSALRERPAISESSASSESVAPDHDAVESTPGSPPLSSEDKLNALFAGCPQEMRGPILKALGIDPGQPLTLGMEVEISRSVAEVKVIGAAQAFLAGVLGPRP